MHALEKEMATHSSILAWRIPWVEEPGRWQAMGLQKSQTQLSDQTAITKPLVASLILKTILWQFASVQLSFPFPSQESGDLSLGPVIVC